MSTFAKASFRLLKADPKHPGLRFKKAAGYWSARVGINYRAVAIEDEADFLWIWIGTHAEYELLLKR